MRRDAQRFRRADRINQSRIGIYPGAANCAFRPATRPSRNAGCPGRPLSLSSRVRVPVVSCRTSCLGEAFPAATQPAPGRCPGGSGEVDRALRHLPGDMAQEPADAGEAGVPSRVSHPCLADSGPLLPRGLVDPAWLAGSAVTHISRELAGFCRSEAGTLRSLSLTECGPRADDPSIEPGADESRSPQTSWIT